MTPILPPFAPAPPRAPGPHRTRSALAEHATSPASRSEWRPLAVPVRTDSRRAGRRHLLLCVTRALVGAPSHASVWEMLSRLRSLLDWYEQWLRDWYARHPGSRDARTGEEISPFP